MEQRDGPAPWPVGGRPVAFEKESEVGADGEAEPRADLCGIDRAKPKSADVRNSSSHGAGMRRRGSVRRATERIRPHVAI
jgi:hypothetical protein